jgi:sugar phosphate isomerase/epimerase
MFNEVNASTWAFENLPVCEALPIIRHLGFESVEIWGDTPSHFDPTDPRQVETLIECLEASGLRADSIHAPFGRGEDISSPNPSIRSHALETILGCVECGKKLGARAIVAHPGHIMAPGEEPERYRLASESLEEVCGKADELGIAICLENLLSDRQHLVFCDTLPKVLHLVRSLEEGVAICVDTSHGNIMGNVSDEIEICGEAIIRTHISDNFGEKDDHLPPGDGRIDWDSVFTSLERISYPGPLTLEIAGRGEPEIMLKRAKSRVEEILRERGYR